MQSTSRNQSGGLLGRCRMPILAALCLLGSVLALSGPALAGTLDGTCQIGNVPSATLLFPYFEVDLDDPEGKQTLVSINNASSEPALAHVVVWSDCHLPVYSFDVFLRGNDVATLNLRDIFVTGDLIETSPDAAGQAAFPSCGAPIVNPPLGAAARAELRAKLTGQPAPSDGMCWGSEREDESRLAVGFLTVDTLNDCSNVARFPDDEGYFVAGGNGVASNDNVLWGDYYLINSKEDFAQGYEAVGIVADPDRFVGTDNRSFYQVTVDERDDRVPISSKLRSRYLNGGIFDGSTQFTIWAQRSPDLVPFTCGAEAGRCPAAGELVYQLKFYDEDSQPLETINIGPPAFVGRYDVSDLGAVADFGFLEITVQGPTGPIGPPGELERRQAWMTQTSSALGRFSVGMSATRLDDLCKVPDQGE